MNFLLVVLIILLLIHHRYKHRNDKNLSKVQKWFQWQDVDNHETIILLTLGVMIGINL